MTQHHEPSHDEVRRKLQDDIAAFLAHGGHIDHVDDGASSCHAWHSANEPHKLPKPVKLHTDVYR